MLSNTDLGDVALSQCLDISNGKLAEESAALTAELAHTLVADLVRSACSIKTVHQHSLARCLEPQLFLILQRAQCGEGAELMMEGGNAHPCGRCQVFHMQRLGKIGPQPRDRSCRSLLIPIKTWGSHGYSAKGRFASSHVSADNFQILRSRVTNARQKFTINKK
jgi:hypothetical protein